MALMDSLTPGAHRALERAEAQARSRGSSLIEPDDLLVALAEDAESRAVGLLTEHGTDLAVLFEILGLIPKPDSEPEREFSQATPTKTQAQAPVPVPLSADLRVVLADAVLLAKSFDRTQEVGTEHLLGALLETPGPITERLTRAGLRLDDLIRELKHTEVIHTTPIPLAAELGELELVEPGEAANLSRILDASGNRAREGLRVVEDYTRFALDDPGLTRRIKNVRHRLAEALQGLDHDGLITARDTLGDVGTHIMTASEQSRENPKAVLIANFKRVGEALRSLEEYAKLVDIWLAGRFEVLRYDVYVIEKLVLTALASRRTLDDARLYLLIGGLPTPGELFWVVEQALAGGAQVIQLREKRVPDRELLKWAREIRILTAKAKARFVLNDRPDLAILSGADGVHLGQGDLALRDARRVIGPRALVGLSTHDASQLDAAVLAGASYLGVGPVFPSVTKDFALTDLAGLAFVRHAAETTSLPWFAVGGITEENLDGVLEAGATRIAVSSAIVHAERPRDAAARLRAKLDAIG
jgi:thiamine-phosphate pyrophosphorylase